MVHQPETVMSREAMPEARELFNVTEKIPSEKLYGFTQFLRGISYGLDMATGKQVAERPGA